MRYVALPLVLALLATTSAARIRFVPLLELATLCDVVVQGRVTEVGATTATIEVARSFKRELPRGPLVVTPNTRETCTGGVPNFAVGEEVVVFLAEAAGGPFLVLAGGQGKVLIPEGRTDEVFAATSKLVEIAKLDDRDRAMIGLAASDSATLRRQARDHISMVVAYEKDRERHRESLVALLAGPHPETRCAGLLGLQFVKAPEALERMIALTRDEDSRVVEAASQALAQYDADATVEALVRLTRPQSRDVRTRAIIDLRNSGNPRALEALLGLLDDTDAKIREQACRGLVGWLHREDGAFAARIGILMVEDAPRDARGAAAGTPWEVRNPKLVEPLARLLSDAKPGGPAEASSLESLRQIQRHAGDAGKRDVQAHLDLVRRSLRRGTGGLAPVEILGAANDVGELRWAAKEHPDAAVRGLAQSFLARPQKAD